MIMTKIQENSGTTNLRTLTRKSTLGFGKNANDKIDTLLKVQHGYLVWVYFNCSKITFIPEILEELKITGEWLIEKPGTAPEEFQYEFKRTNSTYKDLPIEEKRVIYNRKRRNEVRKATMTFYSRKNNSKSAAQHFNQGHRL